MPKLLLHTVMCASLMLLAIVGQTQESIEQKKSSEQIETIIVTAHPLSGEGLSQASKVLKGKELEQNLSTNIGTTLAHQAGIHVAQFGSAVGQPVIHGLGGPRIRTMEDGIDTLDVSVTSSDHAVTVEPFIAKQIEVLKGSGALLYGSGAIGGIVNINTGRIPLEILEKSITGAIETRFNTNNKGNITATVLDGSLGKVAWHLDFARKEGTDYSIPGFVKSANLLQLEATSGVVDSEQRRDVLIGSAFHSDSYAGGLSYINDWGVVGASIGRIEADYGLPGAESSKQGAPQLVLGQTRIGFFLGIKNPFDLFENLSIRLATNNYRHNEIEPDGEIATTFTNKGYEFRIEFDYEFGNWNGAFGLQHSNIDFLAVGEETFIPPVVTSESGFFLVTERKFGKFSLETGLRLGRLEHHPDTAATLKFTTLATSVGVVVPWTEQLQLGLLADLSSRAPVSTELYSNGPHLSTATFELGDPTLSNESALNIVATLNYKSQIWSLSITTYYTQFFDFIYAQNTGDSNEELPVFQFRQDDARFIGADLEMNVTVAEWQNSQVKVRGLLDFVNARLLHSTSNKIPRIPPLRFGLGVEASVANFTLAIDYTRVTKQDAVADFELASPGYNDLRAYLTLEMPFKFASLNLFVSGKNLLNEEQRNHTSFIKDFAPAPGLAIEVGVRLLF